MCHAGYSDTPQLNTSLPDDMMMVLDLQVIPKAHRYKL